MSTLEQLFESHVLVGGTHWDQERRATFATCQCGERAYLVEGPRHSAHLAEMVQTLLAETSA